MNLKQLLDWIETQTTSELSDLQQKVVREVWEGKTYQDIANTYGYNVQYVKDVGYQLWHLLSEVCGDKITKKNFRVKIEKLANTSANTVNNYRDWADAPDTSIFFGRNRELKLLTQWIVKDCCRLVGIVGMVGIGKTKLSVKLGQEIQDEFECVIWRSLAKPLPIKDFITDLIQFITKKEITKISNNLERQISQLLYLLKQHRCLLILDNIETILGGCEYAGRYCQEDRDYDRLFSQIGLVNHQSCLIITSREKPYDLDRMSGKNHPVRFFKLSGLRCQEGKKIFQAIGNFLGSDREWQTLIKFYNGNPLALEIVAHHVRAVFRGNISEFLKEEKYIVDELQDLLDWHFERLSSAEKEIIYCLATNWQPISLAELKINLRSLDTKNRITDILQSLSRRLAIETSFTGYSLQPMLKKYLDREIYIKFKKPIKIVPPETVYFGYVQEKLERISG